MGACIFFGNGLNRVIKDDIVKSWEKLLDGLTESKNVHLDSVPNTLRYEHTISLMYNNKNQNTEESVEKEAKIKIAEEMKKYKSNSIYEQLANLPVVDYMTTNYDSAFEKALNEIGFNVSTSDSGDMSEGRYSIYRHKQFEDRNGNTKRLWFVHGICEKPRSIMLGYDQYGGQIRKMGEYINGSAKKNKNTIPRFKDKLSGTNRFDGRSWIELFFNSDVHFIGLGLPYDEIDLWWLLCRRNRLMRECTSYNIINRIVFHDTIANKTNVDSKRKLYEGLDVRYCPHPVVDENYSLAYDEIIEEIKKAMIE